MQCIVFESTYNTYWLLDGLQENGYKVHLANPSEMETYSGVKHQDDKFSSFKLAEALATGRLNDLSEEGSANRKNGNRYLSWAFAEASAIARRRNKHIQAYFNRKRAKTKVPIAHKAVSNKLAKAAYYIMRDKVPFHIDMFVR
jgi:transposase